MTPFSSRDIDVITGMSLRVLLVPPPPPAGPGSSLILPLLNFTYFPTGLWQERIRVETNDAERRTEGREDWIVPP